MALVIILGLIISSFLLILNVKVDFTENDEIIFWYTGIFSNKRKYIKF